MCALKTEKSIDLGMLDEAKASPIHQDSKTFLLLFDQECYQLPWVLKNLLLPMSFPFLVGYMKQKYQLYITVHKTNYNAMVQDRQSQKIMNETKKKYLLLFTKEQILNCFQNYITETCLKLFLESNPD